MSGINPLPISNSADLPGAPQQEQALKVSIIIPTRNEADCIRSLLEQLQPFRNAGHEVILVDGGSWDGTLDCVHGLVDHVTTTQRGRSYQQNEGAARSTGDVFWFVHADSKVPRLSVEAIQAVMEDGVTYWGRFDVHLSGANPLYRVIEWGINRRSKRTGIATGDQGIFVRRNVFFRLGGFPEIDLMEDIALSKKLRALGPPASPNMHMTTSSRRWEQHGGVRTILQMWVLRAAYFMGVSPRVLSRYYSFR